MKDLPKHQGQRRQLADLLKKKGIKEPQILNAIATVPRHFFMDKYGLIKTKLTPLQRIKLFPNPIP